MPDRSVLPEAVRRRTAFIHARLASVGCAAHGISALVRREHNAWVHLGASLIVVAAGWVLHASMADWRWLMLAIAIVWLTEAINTAVERLCDRVSPQFDPAIGEVKDLAAGSVLIAAIGAGLIGLSVLGPLLREAVA